ncbi:hypothetical protein H5410_022159, partial [Solanum commersonii]
IERAVRKLNGCIRQVENLHPSGDSEKDIVSNSTSSQRSSGVKKAKMKRKVDEGFSSTSKSVELQNDQLAEMLANSNSEKKLDTELKDRALKLKEYKEENKIILMNLNGIVDPNVMNLFEKNKFK